MSTNQVRVPSGPPLVPKKNSEEWLLTAKKSCLNMSVMEPCVNKAVAHLEILKELAHKKSKGLSIEISKRLSSALRAPNESEEIKLSQKSENSSELVAEGFAVGIPKTTDKAMKLELDVHSMVSGMMNLLARLEKDRQDVLQAIEAEREKAKMLQQKLDREGERRLAILPELVQEEHEQCMKDIKHLKWHAAREWKKLRKEQESERLYAQRNNELKQELQKYIDAGPQIKEKMEHDKIRIEVIAAEQEKASKELAVATKECEEVTEEFRQLTDDSISERQNLTTTKSDIEKELFSAQDDLKAICSRHGAVTKSVQEAEIRIMYLREKIDDMVADENNKQLKLTSLTKHVKELSIECNEMDEERSIALERKEKLLTALEKQEKMFDAKRQALKKEKDDADSALKKSKRSVEEMEQNIDTARETIITTKKKIADDEKSIERAQHELTDLEKQTEVALADFSRVQQDHTQVSDEINLEKYRMTEEVDLLQNKIGSLNQAIQDENRIKCLYESKIGANKAQMEKLKVEYEQAIDEAQKSVETSEELGLEQEARLTDLEKYSSERSSYLKSIEEELAIVEKEYVTSKEELTGKISLLAPQNERLRVELQENVNKVDSISENIKELEIKIEEASKSSKVMEKLEMTTSTAIESLKSELGILEEKLAIEKLKEQSWRDEYKEISDFSAEADAKHSAYLKDRSKYLENCKSSLFGSISRNSEISDGFLKVQKEFIEIKACALAAMEARLKLENSVKDHEQLLMSLDCMLSSLKEYYHLRGEMSHWNLEHFTHSSVKNVHDLHSLKRKYEHILKILQKFFNEENKEVKTQHCNFFTQ